MITNGWSYLCFAIGVYFKIGWLTTISSTYIAFLYFPFTLEKIITIPIAIWLQERLFPRDVKLHNELVNMHIQVKKDFRTLFKVHLLRKDLKKLFE